MIVQDTNYSYVYGLGGLISQTDGSGNQTYFLDNGLGSTEKLTDGLGNVIAGYKYDVFGAVRSTSGTGWSEYRFTGQEDDAALGYTYLRARYYDPATGRFISKDPFPGLQTIPWTLHPYAYASNNPPNLIDPSGECPHCLFNTLIQVVQKVGPPVVQAAQRGLSAVQRVIDACRGIAVRPITSTAPRNAYEVAKAGGRHSGTLVNYAKRSTPELERALASYEKQVAIHAEKIATPAEYVEGWAAMSPQEQSGQIIKWGNDLARNRELADIMRGMLQKRGVLP